MSRTASSSASPHDTISHSRIAGIGMDLIYLDRIERALVRFGERFAAKILGADELQVFQRRKQRDARRGVRFLATRFAAKEAFSKAIALGMHAPMAGIECRWRPACD